MQKVKILLTHAFANNLNFRQTHLHIYIHRNWAELKTYIDCQRALIRWRAGEISNVCDEILFNFHKPSCLSVIISFFKRNFPPPFTTLLPIFVSLPGDDYLNRGNILHTVQTSYASSIQLFLWMRYAAPMGSHHSHLLLRVEQFSLYFSGAN